MQECAFLSAKSSFSTYRRLDEILPTWKWIFLKWEVDVSRSEVSAIGESPEKNGGSAGNDGKHLKLLWIWRSLFLKGWT